MWTDFKLITRFEHMIVDALVVLDDPIQNVSHYPFSHINPDGIQTVPKLWRVSPWFLSTLIQLLIRLSTNLLAMNLHRLTLLRFRLDEMIARGHCSWFIGAKLLSQPMMTSSNGNIFRVTGHLCGEFNGPRWISRTKASDAELWCFIWSASESTVE